MSKRWLAIFLLLALVAAGCSGDDSDDSTGSSDDEEPAAQTLTIKVDGVSDDFKMSSNAFFPAQASVHPGDTVEFEEVWTGEPHTVTFGTMVNTAFAAVDKLPPDAEGPPPAELLKLPDIFGAPPTFEPINQSAGQPCFLATGEPPLEDQACPKTEQPDFDGSQTFYNSGYLLEGDKFTVKFDDSIKPGSYDYLCLVHREGMRGKVDVVAASKAIPDADEVSEEGDKALKERQDALRPVAVHNEKATADKATAGGLSEKFQDSQVNEFGPKEITVEKGGTVNWTVFLFHTITLNPRGDEPFTVLIKEDDGKIRLSSAGPPLKAPMPPPVSFENPKPATVQATWDGTGTFNSGIMAGFPPDALINYKVKFTKEGTYNLQCMIHPEMAGKVTVT